MAGKGKTKNSTQANNSKGDVKNKAIENNAETHRPLDQQDGQVINPIAYAIKLRAIHPHDSYGRCGYRFNKESEVEISADKLTGEQILILAEDPWLELAPVCEE